MVEDMEPSAPPAEESGNRMFLIGAIILGTIYIMQRRSRRIAQEAKA